MASKSCVVKDVPLNPFCAAFPEPTAEEYAKLRDSMRATGQRVPIMLDADRLILDGRTRFQICQELFIRPIFERWKGRGSPELYLQYVVDMNVHRRHLTIGQRAAIAARMATISPGKHQNAEETVAHAPSIDGAGCRVSTKNAAKSMGVSTATVERAKRVIRENPEAVQDIESGKKTVHAAAKEIDEKKVAPVDVYDHFKNKLDGKHADDFSASDSLKTLKNRVDTIRRDIQAMIDRGDRMTTWLHWQAVESSLHVAARGIFDALPYCLCPKCSGAKCQACRGIGWLSKEHYQYQPEELRWERRKPK